MGNNEYVANKASQRSFTIVGRPADAAVAVYREKIYGFCSISLSDGGINTRSGHEHVPLLGTRMFDMQIDGFGFQVLYPEPSLDLHIGKGNDNESSQKATVGFRCLPTNYLEKQL